jgi:alkylation response protein AidB-like acyl-CoA dehydrogenase
LDFRLSKEHEDLRARARAFADEVVAPLAGKRDREHIFPEEILQAAREVGYTGLIVPKSMGGLDVGNLGMCLVLEEIARVDASAHVTLSVHSSLATSPIKAWGGETLKNKYLPELAKGNLIGAYALTEPHAGSDAAALSTTAVRDGDRFVLNGTKMWITTGARADLLVVFARTDKDAPKAKGISAFVVDGNQPGVTYGKKENKTGICASETVQIFFENVSVPLDHLLGEENKGFYYALETLNGGRIGIATQAVGIAQGALDVTMKLLSEHPAPKGSAFATQDVDFRLSEMATAIEASRLLVYRAAFLKDHDLPHMREASMAKLMASKTANEVCRQAVAMLGARGFSGSYAVERMFRDARITEIYEGTTEIQKLVIARNLKDA